MVSPSGGMTVTSGMSSPCYSLGASGRYDVTLAELGSGASRCSNGRKAWLRQSGRLHGRHDRPISTLVRSQ
jgi:hypothetical protein